MSIMELRRGDVVRAIKDSDPEGANVKVGDLGVVFQPADFHEEGTGPMVRWLFLHQAMYSYTVRPGGVCNVYEGWVEKVEPQHADIVER